MSQSPAAVRLEVADLDNLKNLAGKTSVIAWILLLTGTWSILSGIASFGWEGLLSAVLGAFQLALGLAARRTAASFGRLSLWEEFTAPLLSDAFGALGRLLDTYFLMLLLKIAFVVVTVVIGISYL